MGLRQNKALVASILLGVILGSVFPIHVFVAAYGGGTPPPPPPPPPPDFSISVSPTSGEVTMPGTATATVTVTSLNGYSLTVSLSASGQPAGVTVSFSPSSGTPTFTSSMTISVDSSARAGYYTITITGTGADNKVRNCTYALSVITVMEVKLWPTDDAFTDLRDNPGGNYGSASWMGVNQATESGAWPSGLGEGTFLKFDLSGIPPGTKIKSVTFHAYAYQIWWESTCSSHLRAFGTNWDEGTITGNNAPWASLGWAVSNTVQGSIPSWWVYEVDASYVQSKLGGEIGFYLCYPGTAGGLHYGQYYRSKEYPDPAYRPYLKVVVEVRGDDADNKEVGVWWHQNYRDVGPSGFGNLENTKTDAEGFYSTLVNKNFTGRFKLGGPRAWESHFEATSIGGLSSVYADAVDFAYFAGHGDENAFWFGINRDGNAKFGSKSVHPIADAWVTSAYPNNNYGSDNILRVGILDNENYYSFLKFDIGPLPTGAVIARATLHVYCVSPLAVGLLDASSVADDAWGEMTITYNNMPVATGKLDTLTLRDAGWYSWDVTYFVGREYRWRNDSVVSFRLAADPPPFPYGVFCSRENLNYAPYLQVTYTIGNAEENYPYRVHYSEAAWGSRHGDLEWIFIAACEVLKESAVDRWRVGRHTHGIAGFHTWMLDRPDLGRLLAEYLTDIKGPLTIHEAWRRATKLSQNDPTIYAAIFRGYRVVGSSVTDLGQEYLPGYGSGMRPDPDYLGEEGWTREYEKWPCYNNA